MKTTRAPLRVIEGSITTPRGFKAAAVFCDIKRLGTGKGSEKGRKNDLAVICSDVPASVAGMFTTNQVCAAPVKVSIPRAARASAQAIVVNSGNANACTGERGLRDAASMAGQVERLLKLPAESALVCSTGRIGLPLPMANVKKGIRDACAALMADQAAGHGVAEAIMTSDTRPKEVVVQFELEGRIVSMAGICKGAGMIQPGMSANGRRPAAGLHATMLGFITTDAAIDSTALKESLGPAVAASFNRITVDGDMSTNDTVLVLANGLAGNRILTRKSRGLAIFREALNFVTLELAKKIVLDGEGVSRFVTVRLHGASSAVDADAAVRAVANSSLVKTSWCGGDPNWGRILGALGYSSAKIVESRLDVGYSLPGEKQILFALKQGRPTAVPFPRFQKIVKNPAFDLHIFLNLGKHDAVMYAADLTEEYVDFNKGVGDDPAALGG